MDNVSTKEKVKFKEILRCMHSVTATATGIAGWPVLPLVHDGIKPLCLFVLVLGLVAVLLSFHVTSFSKKSLMTIKSEKFVGLA